MTMPKPATPVLSRQLVESIIAKEPAVPLDPVALGEKTLKDALEEAERTGGEGSLTPAQEAAVRRWVEPIAKEFAAEMVAPLVARIEDAERTAGLLDSAMDVIKEIVHRAEAGGVDGHMHAVISKARRLLPKEQT